MIPGLLTEPEVRVHVGAESARGQPGSSAGAESARLTDAADRTTTAQCTAQRTTQATTQRAAQQLVVEA